MMKYFALLILISNFAYAGFIIPGKAKTVSLPKTEPAKISAQAPTPQVKPQAQVQAPKEQIISKPQLQASEALKQTHQIITKSKQEKLEKEKNELAELQKAEAQNKLTRKQLFYSTRKYILNLPLPIIASIPSEIKETPKFSSKFNEQMPFPSHFFSFTKIQEFKPFTKLDIVQSNRKLLWEDSPHGSTTQMMMNQIWAKRVFEEKWPNQIKQTTKAVEPPEYIRLEQEDLVFLSALIDLRLGRPKEALKIFYNLKDYSKTFGKRKSLVFAAMALSELNLRETASYLLSEYFTKEQNGKYVDFSIEKLSKLIGKIHAPITLLNKYKIYEERTKKQNPEVYRKMAYLQNLKALRSDDSCIAKDENNIDKKDENTLKCKFLKGVRLAKENKINEAKALFIEVADNTKNDNLKNIANSNAGRSNFLSNNFDEAIKRYKEVNNKHTLWLESSTELAWAELRSNKPEGTIGNLNILHSQFAKNALLAESFTIKALGYEQLCQFGDALNSIRMSDNLYKPSHEWLKNFNSQNKDKPSAYYKAVADAIRGTSSAPRPAIIELARSRSFLNAQERINGMIKEEKDLALLNANLKSDSSSYFSKEKDLEIKEAELALKRDALELEENLTNLFANNAILEYEIYSAASSNIEIHNAKNFKDAVPQKQRSMSDLLKAGREAWPVESEIWEDELNNFRTKLINLCTGRGN